MLSPRVIGAYLALVNRRAMRFGPEASHVPLPRPVAGRQYLLYLHVPFCEVLCPFCSFHRVRHASGKAHAYFEVLHAELRHYQSLGFRFGEVYVGGGTPTVEPRQLADTLALIRELFGVRQISVETNPNHLDPERIRLLRDCGVDRLSVGIQSFDNLLLEAMGRMPYGNDTRLRERLRRVIGEFPAVNVDLLFNLPGQTAASLARDLRILRDELRVDQVSCYPLMVAGSTARAIQRSLGRLQRNREADLYELICDELLPDYQPSSAWCFSRRPGLIDEYIISHDEYLAAGSGAFSCLDGRLYASSFSLPRYQHQVARQGCGVTRVRTLTPMELRRYYFMLAMFALRIDKTAARSRFGADYFRQLWRELLCLQLLGALRDRGDYYEVTQRGRYYAVVMMREFLTGVNRLRDQMRAHIRTELGWTRA